MNYLKKMVGRYKNEGFVSATSHFCKTFVNGIKCFTRFISKNLCVFIIKYMKHLKIKEYIVFECESDFADNPRTFYEYLLKSGFTDKHKIIWLVKNVDYCLSKFAHKNVVFIDRCNKSIKNVVRLNYFLSVSKWFIFSHPYWFTDWREGQIVIHTTHSVAQLKGKGQKFQKKIFDYVMACSEYGSKIKQEILYVRPEYIICTGMPRIDLMFESVCCKSNLIENYDNEKLIVSMETFKQATYWSDSDHVDSYAINVINNETDLLDFDEFLGKNKCKMIIKIHHLQDLSFLKTVELKNIYYLTDEDLFYKDIQVNTLLTNADILLTDYSSVFYDYLLVDRPIGFLLGDFESYSRGFVMDDPLSEMPGEKIYNIESLKSFITSSINGKDEFAEDRKLIRDKVFQYQDNNNCQRLYQWMISKEEK